MLRAYTAVAALTAMPSEALAEPGLLDKVISLGSTAPRYSAPGPSRAELLAALDLDRAGARLPRSARR